MGKHTGDEIYVYACCKSVVYAAKASFKDFPSLDN